MLDKNDIFGDVLQKLTPKARQVVDEVYNAYVAYRTKQTEDLDLLDEAINIVLQDKMALKHLFANMLLTAFKKIAREHLSEYNYSLFIDAFQRATYGDAFFDNIIFNIDERSISSPISIKFDRDAALGSPESYMSAVKAVRRANYIRGDILKRSRAWMYGIYKPARESFVLISEKKRVQLEREGVNIGQYTFRKQQEARFKYDSIIKERLDLHGKAGFWYFMEYGNIGFKNTAGFPYPDYPSPPYGFITKTVKEFRDLINQRVINEYNKLIEKEKQEGISDKEFNEFINNLVEGIEEDNYNKVVRGLYLGESLKDRLVYRKSGRLGIRRRR